MRARIRKTVAFAESVKEAQFADAAARRVSLSWAPGKVLGGKDYLLQMSIPNIYFHLAMAYAILRHNALIHPSVAPPRAPIRRSDRWYSQRLNSPSLPPTP